MMLSLLDRGSLPLSGCVKLFVNQSPKIEDEFKRMTNVPMQMTLDLSYI